MIFSLVLLFYFLGVGVEGGGVGGWGVGVERGRGSVEWKN